MNGFKGRALLAAAIMLGVGGCAASPVGVSGGGGGNIQITQAEYDLNLKKWNAGAPGHYRIVVQQTCECTAEFQRATRVTVRRVGGQQVETIEEVVDAATLVAVSNDRKLAAKSVDGLLVLISQALALNPAESRITYDGTLGYPVSLNIDPVPSIPGDEVVYKVTAFEILP